jgi:subtilisin family serine protease
MTDTNRRPEDMSSVNVAVLNADFDLNHASGNLPFGNPRHNVIDNNEQVDALKGHAHGTLCAGIIGARPGIDGWLSGGIEPASVMLPVAVYRTTDPVRAELGISSRASTPPSRRGAMSSASPSKGFWLPICSSPRWQMPPLWDRHHRGNAKPAFGSVRPCRFRTVERFPRSVRK